MSDWKRRELKEKKRREYRDSRISGDHELSGTRHRQPHRGKDIKLNWQRDASGKYHVTPSSVPVGGGIDISDEDWDEIWRDKSDERRREMGLGSDGGEIGDGEGDRPEAG